MLAANQGKPRRYEVKAAADEATVYLYDAIDSFFGVSANQFVKDLNAIKAPVINLRINSPGGDVFDGRAIATAISQHPSKVIAHVDGLAASAASYVAIAADEVVMAPGAFMMIHKAWTLAFGNQDDLLATAAVLEKIDQSLVETYVAKTGASAEQVAEWMAAETWFTAQEAVDQKFADRVAEDAPSAKAAWDLSAYDKTPEPAPIEDNSEVEHADRVRHADFLLNVA